MLILGIDAGNHKAKIAGIYGVESYKTNICNWFERDVMETFGGDDMDFLIDGRKGYAGTIAEFEDEFGTGATYGESKAHEETKIRVLLGIYRYMQRYCPAAHDIAIVTGQPISRHKEEEKNKIIHMLKGPHNYFVNGKPVTINIKDVKVTPEASGAFWSNPEPGEIKIIDIGSGTVNFAHISNRNHLHRGSGTMNIGMETLKNKNDLEGMARGIIQHSTKLKWGKHDKVLICGGIAEQMAPYLKKHFEKSRVLTPLLKREYDTIAVPSIYANAVGFYTLAKGAYQ